MRQGFWGKYLFSKNGKILPKEDLVAINNKHPADAIYYTDKYKKLPLFEVDIAHCYNLFHFSFFPKGFHPLVYTLRELIADPDAPYSQTMLKKFYDIFQPKALGDCFFEDSYNSNKFLTLSPYCTIGPWQPTVDPKGYSGAFGPLDESKIKNKIKRVQEIYYSIKRSGYSSNMFPVGEEIRGYFLQNNSSYRFIVMGGNHRITALSVLGYKRIRAKFQPGYPRVIDIRDIAYWPQVKSGCIDEESAKSIFMKYFNETGVEKAESLGLLKPC